MTVLLLPETTGDKLVHDATARAVSAAASLGDVDVLCAGASMAEAAGEAILQTYQPEHPVIRAILTGDEEAFWKAEAEGRRFDAGHAVDAVHEIEQVDEPEPQQTGGCGVEAGRQEAAQIGPAPG